MFRGKFPGKKVNFLRKTINFRRFPTLKPLKFFSSALPTFSKISKKVSTLIYLCQVERSSWKDIFLWQTYVSLNCFRRFAERISEIWRKFFSMVPKIAFYQPIGTLLGRPFFLSKLKVFSEIDKINCNCKKTFRQDSKTVIDLSRRNNS